MRDWGKEKYIRKERIKVDGGRRRPDWAGLGVEWSGLVIGGGQIGDRWWRLDRPVRWRAWWSTDCGQLSRSVSSLGLWATRSMVRSRGGSNGGGWVVGYRSVTCSWRFSHGWSKEKRENEGGREEGRWTQFARQTPNGGQSLHGRRRTVDGACTATKACTVVRFLWCSLSLSLSLAHFLYSLFLLFLSLSLFWCLWVQKSFEGKTKA